MKLQLYYLSYKYTKILYTNVNYYVYNCKSLRAYFCILIEANYMLDFIELYNLSRENSVQGRYVTNDMIFPFLDQLGSPFQIEVIGKSVLNREIKSVTFGSGKYKILMWSQMHGNESTTTKAVLDFLNLISSNSDLAQKLLALCTFKIIPILNPDGAEAYTRINANEVDLNRDAQDKSQPESKILRAVYDAFIPDYCFNLHDQRTIFNVGATSKPATVSFLAPSHDEERSISKSRGVSMQLIVAMNKELQKYIPGQVGRYDDGFNANCVGDTFQMLNKPTILFESGHYVNDYDREETRKFIFCAIIKGVNVIADQNIDTYEQKDYFEIPENGKLFYDILIKNADFVNKNLRNGADIGILFKETLVSGVLTFVPFIEKTGNLSNFYGHKTFNCLNNKDLENLKSLKEIVDLISKK
ncbi:peptidase M14 carboxypeptidase A [Cellulophaga algicola DSM 14237]|uniref:Peptidase M14 carboxypeptidase A n=1 Tax=Cellulophaga algicola (strain DSM 14237 / IC166 / ACAM 630) TaxID=688270 RepID=E6XFF6_CELAD|nr:M14 metallopeptidase family protein [Cellulophaga algicola]ADV51429.1 peptidase M14 carboxypeptidase A [Cellulophaga algicola DSM 14237]